MYRRTITLGGEEVRCPHSAAGTEYDQGVVDRCGNRWRTAGLPVGCSKTAQRLNDTVLAKTQEGQEARRPRTWPRTHQEPGSTNSSNNGCVYKSCNDVSLLLGR